MKKSELKKAKDELARHREMLQQIIDKSHTHLVYLDPDFNIVAVNADYARTCHRTPEELIGRNHFHFYPNGENEAIFKRVKETGEPVSFVEKPFVFPDQPERGVTYWDWTLTPVRDESNCITGLVFSLVETTGRKKSESALERMGSMLAESQKISHLGSYEYDVAAKQSIWSDEEYRIFGLPREGPAPTFDVMLKCVHPDDVNRVCRTFVSAVESRSACEQEYRIIHPDVSVRWVLDRAHPYFDDTGKLIRYIGTTLDITDRKHFEDALKQSRILLQSIIDGTTDAVYIKDQDGRYLLINKALADFVGMDARDILGHDDTFLFPEDEARIIMERDRKVMMAEKPSTCEEQATTADGMLRTFLSSKGPLFDAAGKITGLFGITRDITGRKRMEEELRQSHENLEATVRERTAELADINAALTKEIAEHRQAETALRENEEKYRRLFENELFAVSIFDTETFRILDVNDTHVKLYGYSRDELLGGMLATDLSAEYEASRISIQNISASGPERVPLRHHRKKDGTVFPVEIAAVPYVFQERRVMFAVVHDITERKAAEHRLMLHAEILSKMTDGVNVVSASTGLFVYINPTCEAMFGYEPGELIGRSPAVLNAPGAEVAPEDMVADIIAALQKNGQWRGDLQNRRKDGRVLWTSANITSHEIAPWGNVWLSIQRDITERRLAEKMIRESEIKYMQLFDLESDALFLVEVKTLKILDVNASTVCLYGYTREELLAMRTPDISAEKKKTREAIGKSVDRVDLRWHRKKDGTVFPVEITGAYFVSGGKRVHLAAVRDITDRHRIEVELREKTENLTEVNAALSALLKRRDTDRKDFEETVESHIRHLVVPYIDSLKNSQLSSNQKTWIEILEGNLNRITSEFTRKVTLQELNLSNAELRVAALVRDGRSTKDISRILMTSEKTVSSHRDSIRSKLGFRGKKGGLRFLLNQLS